MTKRVFVPSLLIVLAQPVIAEQIVEIRSIFGAGGGGASPTISLGASASEDISDFLREEHDFEENVTFEVQSARSTRFGVTYRLRQQIDGIDIVGSELVVSVNSDLDPEKTGYEFGAQSIGDGTVGSARSIVGTVVAGDTSETVPSEVFKGDQGLRQASVDLIEQVKIKYGIEKVENETVEPTYFLTDEGELKPSIQIELYGFAGEIPSNPLVVFDFATGEELQAEDRVANSTDMLRGKGGNIKIGEYEYSDNDGFEISRLGDSLCALNIDGIRAVDLEHGNFGTDAFEFDCDYNDHKEINGAYSPINDAYAFGIVTKRLFEDVVGTPPMAGELILRVHYLSDYENAIWDPVARQMSFGDGRTRFHPLVSLDVVAHEAAHAFTTDNSNLRYADQSGGINEAYSDMAGEAAEYYLRSSNDFLIGHDIRKGNGTSLRSMCDPTSVGNSIDHIDNYNDGMDVHYSSGIFNKAFCHMVTVGNIDILTAFALFSEANISQWQRNSTFKQAAQGVRTVAGLNGVNVAIIDDAFKTVGIDLP